MLIPVHLGGVFLSLRQAWTGKKSAFGRTPKIQGRTAAPPLDVAIEYGILAQWMVVAIFGFLRHRPLHAWFALGNAAFLAYAIVSFIGLRESWTDFAGITRIRALGAAPLRARRSSSASRTPAWTSER